MATKKVSNRINLLSMLLSFTYPPNPRTISEDLKFDTIDEIHFLLSTKQSASVSKT